MTSPQKNPNGVERIEKEKAQTRKAIFPALSTKKFFLNYGNHRKRTTSVQNEQPNPKRTRDESIPSITRDNSGATALESFVFEQKWTDELNQSLSKTTFVMALCYCLASSPGLKEVVSRLEISLAKNICAFVSEKHIAKKAKRLSEIQSRFLYQDLSESEFNPEETLSDMLDELILQENREGTEPRLKPALQVVSKITTKRECCRDDVEIANVSSCFLKIAQLKEEKGSHQSFLTMSQTLERLKCSSCQELSSKKKRLLQIGDVMILSLQQPSSSLLDLHPGEGFGIYQIVAGIERDSEQRFKCYIKENQWVEVNYAGKFRCHSQPKARFSFVIYANSRPKEEISHVFLNGWKVRELFEACLLCFLHSERFVQACYRHKFERHRNFTSKIAATLAASTEIDKRLKCVSRLWEEFKTSFYNVRNPHDFMEEMLKCTFKDRASDDFLAVGMTTYQMCRCGVKWTKNESFHEYTLKLQKPSKYDEVNNAIWYSNNEFFPCDQYRYFLNQDDETKQALYLSKFKKQINRTGHKNITVQDCIEYRQRTIITENKSELMSKGDAACLHNMKENAFYLSILKPPSPLLILQFSGEANSNPTPSYQLSISGKTYTLEGVIRGKEEAYTSYFKHNQQWVYFAKNGTLKSKALSYTEALRDVWLLIYEDSNTPGEIQEWWSKVTNNPSEEDELLPKQADCENIDLRKKLKKRCARKLPCPIVQQKENSAAVTSTHSRKISRSVGLLPGLPNLGMTCYMNGVLNCLFFNQRFRNWMLKFCERDELGKLMGDFAEIYQNVDNLELMKALLSTILSTVFPNISSNEARAANEFFDMLCSKLKPAISKHVDIPFLVYEYLSIICTNCGFLDGKTIPKYELDISMTSDNIQNLLDEKFQLRESTLMCSKCKISCKHTIEPSLQSIGSSIVLYLHWPKDYFKIELPSMLTVSRFDRTFRLTSIIRLIHGNPNHTVAEIILKNWRHLYNDTTATLLPLSEEAPGVPYMLFYERDEISLQHPLGLINIRNASGLSATLNVFYFTPDFARYLKGPKLTIKGNLGSLLFKFVSLYESRSKLDETFLSISNLLEGNIDMPVHSVFLNFLTQLDIDLKDNVWRVLNSDNMELKLRRMGKADHLHEMFSILLESVYLCTECKTVNELPKWDYLRMLDLKVPEMYEHFQKSTREETMFNASEYFTLSSYAFYYPSGNITEYVYHAMYIERMRQKKKIEQLTVEHGIDLITCIKYYFRFHTLSSSKPYCLKCRTNSSHFRQIFPRNIGSILVIHLDREGREGAMVRFSEELDLQQFFGCELKYRLYALVAEVEGKRAVAVVKLKELWFQYDEMKIDEVDEMEAFYRTAQLLFYQQIRN